MAEPSEVEERFEERIWEFDTAKGKPLQGFVRDDWLSDTHQVRLSIDVRRWPRDGKEWADLARFLQHVDCAYRNWLDTHAEKRKREAEDDIPF